MIPEAAAWLIFFLPLGSFVVIGLIVRPFFNRHALVAGYMTIAAVGASLMLSLWALGSVVSEEGAIEWISRSWLSIGAFDLDVGILMDPLTAIMLVVATSVSLMVQIYSVGYMKGDPGYARYYAYMSLFTASMIGLVLASNIIQLYVFWELVGLSSYLLIGFWFTRPAAAAAAKKAFIVTRIGDFGFLLAIMYLFFNRGAFEAAGLNPLMIADIYAAVDAGVLVPRQNGRCHGRRSSVTGQQRWMDVQASQRRQPEGLRREENAVCRHDYHVWPEAGHLRSSRRVPSEGDWLKHAEAAFQGRDLYGRRGSAASSPGAAVRVGSRNPLPDKDLGRQEMGNFEKLVVLVVLFLSAVVLAVSLSDGVAETGAGPAATGCTSCAWGLSC